jgi:ParB-like nuclease domain
VTPESSDLPRDLIVVVPDVQPRIGGLDADHVRTLEASAGLWPPLVVVQQGERFLLVDGFHRFAAAQNLGLATVSVRIAPAPSDGDLRGLAFSLNAVHGRSLTLTDRRAEAGRLLRLHPEWADREIGRRCGLAQPTVAAVRTELERTAQIEQTATRVGQGGYTYSVGANAKQRPPGELPGAGLGEIVGDAVGRLFTTDERRGQRRIAQYLQRLAIALEDQAELTSWETAADAAEACRLVLGEGRAAQLAERLGWASRAVLDAAVALGFADEVAVK